MFEPTSQRDASSGFTLIEIVMVLVLIGILAAVAVPKYFDLQAESEEKTCRYNQKVAIDAIYTQFAAAKLSDDDKLFDTSSESRATSSAQQIVDTLKIADNKGKLCPSGGTFTADASWEGDTYSFTVTCNLHGTKGADSGTSTTQSVTRDNAAATLGNWIQLNYQLSEKWSDKENDPNSDMDAFFTKYDQGRGAIDSEAGYDGSMTDAINKALAQAGLNSNDVIWKLERAAGGPYNDKGESMGKTWNNESHYETDLILTVANKSDIDRSTSTVSASVYTMHVTYGKKNTDTEKIAKVDNAQLKGTKTVDVRNVTTGGNTYMALKTGNGSDSDNYHSSKLQ